MARLSMDEDIEKAEAMNPIKILSTGSEIDAELIINLLRNNNIPCFKKSKGSGGYMNIYMGYSVFGEDIYVDERDYEVALEIVNDLQGEEEPQEEKDEKPEKNIPFYKKPQIVARIIIITMILEIILSVFINKAGH